MSWLRWNRAGKLGQANWYKIIYSKIIFPISTLFGQQNKIYSYFPSVLDNLKPIIQHRWDVYTSHLCWIIWSKLSNTDGKFKLPPSLGLHYKILSKTDGKYILPICVGLNHPRQMGSIYFPSVWGYKTHDWWEVYTSHLSKVILDCIYVHNISKDS